MKMSMNNLLRKMAIVLERKQNALFSFDVMKQKKYIEQLGNPKDEIERSYFQYKCQMLFNGRLITYILDCVSFPVAIVYLVKFGKKRNVKKLDSKDLIFFRDGKPENILPNSLKNKYQSIETKPLEGIILTKFDKKIIKNIIFRYPFSWHFILKCIIKIGKYSYAIKKYSPKVIVVCAEYSFTSSVLTKYCREKEIKHINVMHGEKLYYIRDAFFEFDECYVWDKYYVNLLSDMKAETTQFIIEIPNSLKFNGLIKRTCLYDYTYYLGAENEITLKKISLCLKRISDTGKRISVRPHPRYSNIETIKKLFSFSNIEDVKNISIEKSLMRTGYAISLYSTVLNQALFNSVPIVIDNYSNIDNFRKLDELGYVCLKKDHLLLSNIMEELK